CADGWIIIATGNDGQFQRLCGVLGLGDVGEMAAYKTNADRVANRDELIETLMIATKQWSKGDLLAACEGANVPAGPINDMAEVFADPQVKARGMVGEDNGVPVVRAPMRFSDAELAEPKAAPAQVKKD
ncbi:MAG: CoA transferase, partial [Marinomonas sp.]